MGNCSQSTHFFQQWKTLFSLPVNPQVKKKKSLNISIFFKSRLNPLTKSESRAAKPWICSSGHFPSCSPLSISRTNLINSPHICSIFHKLAYFKLKTLKKTSNHGITLIRNKAYLSPNTSDLNPNEATAPEWQNGSRSTPGTLGAWN